MDYHYEALDEHGFQKLCQALLVAKHPDTQCLPVRQPDGGRDAYLPQFKPQDGFVVFQVKYTEEPSTKSARQVVEQAIQTEQSKVHQLIKRGATRYYLLTNVSGTAHLDTGSIDTAEALLKDTFEIPSQVWWRDDLDRRLDTSEDIKWAFSQILKASDLLPILLRENGQKEEPAATPALRSYVAQQHADDREVKFKQVDLHRNLTDLFVDLSLAHKQTSHRVESPPQGHPPDQGPFDGYENTGFHAYLDQLGDFENYGDYAFVPDDPFDHSGLAAAFLLQVPFFPGVSRLVLEGAPGQGKSTVTQFLCQVNRLRLLKHQTELEALPKHHTDSPTRVPFRVDLLDFALWVEGGHPYDTTNHVSSGGDQPRSLETFLAMQVSWRSGGLQIDPDDLVSRPTNEL